ncbi:MAG: general stress protein CsbD [Bacteroidia bacterium]|nr:general stress protein CsbD [Bacteroidia bacterium]
MTTELQGDWNEIKEKLKQKFATLTDNDVLLAEGKQDQMLGRLQVKLGKTREELLKIIGTLFSSAF